MRVVERDAAGGRHRILRLISLASVGLLVAPLAVPIGLFAGWRLRNPWELLGLLSGLGLVVLLVAFIQRDGEWMDPRPWFAVGAALVAIGVLGFAAARASYRRSTG
ncbi:hypothetical protein AYO38_00055 [bacterium SCGC AG-212-C10]|nr:hypothetical protein AYO38_00055 [bacterium SCGC AG-212-C10]